MKSEDKLTLRIGDPEYYHKGLEIQVSPKSPRQTRVSDFDRFIVKRVVQYNWLRRILYRLKLTPHNYNFVVCNKRSDKHFDSMTIDINNPKTIL